MTLGVFAVGAAVAVGGATLGQSGLITETIAGTAAAAEQSVAPSVAATGAGTAQRPAPARTTRTTRPATSAEQVGVVDITTVLDYGRARGRRHRRRAHSNGEILTNNHVVDGATKITVTVVSTGRPTPASVVGTDPTDDVAVLRLSGASGLATTGSRRPQAAACGRRRRDAVGNAGGTGGTPSAATGNVVALDRDITASDESGSDPEQLTGLIQVNATMQAGDSGGPLYAGGAVIGIDTAASTSGRGRVATTAARTGSAGFAIPITTATAVAERIVGGEQSTTIHQGSPAFLGVQLPGRSGRRHHRGRGHGLACGDRGSAGRRHDHRRRRHRRSTGERAVRRARQAPPPGPRHGRLDRHRGHVAQRDRHPHHGACGLGRSCR